MMNKKHSLLHTALFILKLPVLLTVSFALISLGSSSWAGNIMRCGNRLINDGKKPGESMTEVRKKCGQPYDEYGNQLLYVSGDAVYRVYFNAQGNVASIRSEIVR